MASGYYKPCKELDACVALDRYWNNQEYDKWFAGHLPLAECQIGYCYLKGLGVEKDLEQAFAWTLRAAEHGDRDGQYNLGSFYEEGLGVKRDMEQAARWYLEAARQDHDLAAGKCRELRLSL